MKKCIKVLVGSGGVVSVVAFLLFVQSGGANGEEINGGNVGKLQDHLPDDDGNEEGYCAPYNGKICKNFIVSPRSVW